MQSLCLQVTVRKLVAQAVVSITKNWNEACKQWCSNRKYKAGGCLHTPNNFGWMSATTMNAVSKLHLPSTEYLYDGNMSLVGHASLRNKHPLKCNLCTAATFASIYVLIDQTPQRQRETVNKDTVTSSVQNLKSSSSYQCILQQLQVT